MTSAGFIALLNFLILMGGLWLGAFQALEATAHSEALALGILENRVEPEKSVFIRAVFAKDGNAWKHIETGCQKDSPWTSVPFKNWKIGLQGSQRGSVVTHLPKEPKCFSWEGLLDIENPNAVPKVGKISNEFGGFPGYRGYRPLIALSGGEFRNPEPWSEVKLSGNATAKLKNAFRKKFGTAKNCKSPDENKAKPWKYGDAKIVIGNLRSFKAGLLAVLHLKDYRCDGPPENGFLDHWFLLSSAGQVEYLDYGLEFIDSGDFDNDGKAEVLFAVDRYNRGGYKIYFDQFTKSAEFVFGYH